ncbi:MAG: hypothetical protein CM15mV38_1360 [uncultured marine virus]|nr:MAG: hypothetical protein CM15mV38_1360 [uncultured marine virus]
MLVNKTGEFFKKIKKDLDFSREKKIKILKRKIRSPFKMGVFKKLFFKKFLKKILAKKKGKIPKFKVFFFKFFGKGPPLKTN